MPTNKNAFLRYRTLDRCFSNKGRKYSFDDLMDEVNDALSAENPETNGVQKRQLRKDIAFMRSEEGFQAPIETYQEGRRHYYYYDDPEFRISQSALNHSEVEQLKNTLHLLNRFEGATGFEWLSEMNNVIKDKFQLNADAHIVGYEDNVDYTGYPNLTPLFNAIANKKVLKITYQPFGQEPIETIFHPYYLKQFNKRWFVLGRNEEEDVNTWNFPLDRIVDIEETENEYKSTDMDWEDYFYDIVGVTKLDGDPVEVRLRFEAKRGNYVKTKPLHPSQKHKEMENGGIEVRIKVIPNKELSALLLSFGPDVEVLEPNELRNEMKERSEKMNEKYNGVQ
jgi:predicted DNA-binding transcriptional regulator YafY